MTPSVFLGIDTSNYRTSVALTDSSDAVIAEKAVLLEVPAGSRGLRQSEAFWHHSGRLPDYLKELSGYADLRSISAIGVSSRPRRVEGSYMPCFMAGLNLAESLGTVLTIPVYTFSHQEGHAAAILPEDPGRCVFMHLSGGTTEFLLCEPDQDGYDMTLVGGTKDISAGQLIDRAGVAMGAAFPSGPQLDEVALRYFEDHGPDLKASERILPAVKIKSGYFNLSGAETRILRYIETNGLKYTDPSAAAVIFEAFSMIAGVLCRSAAELADRCETSTVYMAGGVASSATVRALIRDFTINNTDIKIIFGDPQHSSDNAYGIAKLARRIHETGKCISGK